jgi:hypothetical protein
LERARGFEPLTTCLGSKDSTTELRPLTESNPTLAFIPSQEMECPDNLQYRSAKNQLLLA